MRGAGKIRYRVKAAVLVFCAFIFPVSVPGAEVTLSLDDVSRAVVFLHVPASAGAGMIEIGTGFLVRIEDELFLVTAAHVAKLMDLRASMTLGDDGVLAKTYNIPFLIGKAAEPQWLLNPAADVAVLRLYLSDSLKKLIASRALPAQDILVGKLEAPPRARPLTIVGYPLGLGIGADKISAISKELKAASGLITLPRFDNKQLSDFFIADSPSAGGFSGAPVFALPSTYTEKANTLTIASSTFLVGLVHGTLSDDTGGKFAAIVPAAYIARILETAFNTRQ